jgi:hypothetical protein
LPSLLLPSLLLPLAAAKDSYTSSSAPWPTASSRKSKVVSKHATVCTAGFKQHQRTDTSSFKAIVFANAANHLPAMQVAQLYACRALTTASTSLSQALVLFTLPLKSCSNHLQPHAKHTLENKHQGEVSKSKLDISR